MYDDYYTTTTTYLIIKSIYRQILPGRHLLLFRPATQQNQTKFIDDFCFKVQMDALNYPFIGRASTLRARLPVLAGWQRQV
jgi:hypothetical protein